MAWAVNCDTFLPARSSVTSILKGISSVNGPTKFVVNERSTLSLVIRCFTAEYNIPAEVHGEVIQEVMKVASSGKYPVHFPIENRFVKADDIYMSPAYGRDSAYIACHMYNKKDCKPYFKELEDIFKSYGGRPHWGKMNTFTTEDVRNAYPEFETFLKHRKEQDPEGVFLNDYLRGLLGV